MSEGELMSLDDYIDSIEEDLTTVEQDFSLYHNVNPEKIKNDKGVIEARKRYAKTIACAIRAHVLLLKHKKKRGQ